MPSIRYLLPFFFALCASAQPANHRWSDAAKEAVGTAYGKTSSPVWFTVGHGIINEVYYPRVDTAQVGDSQLLFTNRSKAYFLEEKRDFIHHITHPESIPRPIISSRYDAGADSIAFTKEIITDPSRPILRIKYRFTALPEDVVIYILHKPTAGNDGAGDRGKVLVSNSGVMVFNACDGENTGHCQSVTTTAKVKRASVGVVGETDGWQDLNRYGRMVNEIEQNGPSNIALMAQLAFEINKTTTREFEIDISFGPNPQNAYLTLQKSLKTSFETVQRDYDEGWQSYHNSLLRTPWVAKLASPIKETLLWNASIVKTHEDRSNPGAIIASLSIPYIPMGTGHPDGKETGGYHLVWPRDLFKSALSLLRMGDVYTAYDALKFMSRMEHSGHISQNTWVDGRPFWTGEQMDQEAFPLLLANELERAGVVIDDPELRGFLLRRLQRLQESSGWTGQERWEEAGGYSPNTLAVMAAALSRAGDMAGARRIVDVALAKTVSYQGPLSTFPYFVRIAQTGAPDAGNYLHIANGGPSLPEYRVLDGGFLEWLRWFPNPKEVFGDAGIQLEHVLSTSLALYDNPNNGVFDSYNGIPLYKRYTSDAYGMHKQAGPWPILTAERALPEVSKQPAAGLRFVQYIKELWGPGDLCPEQLGPDMQPMPHAASPLVWCHAEMIELTHKSLTTRN